MTEEKNIKGPEVFFWIAWLIVSPLLLYTLIVAPAGLALAILVGLNKMGFVLVGAFALAGGLAGRLVCGRNGGFTKGVIFSVAPFLVLFGFFSIQHSYFSDESSTKNAENEAGPILAKQAIISINGLYTESIPLRYGLYGMLAERHFPIIEGDVAGLKWLFDLAKDQQTLAERAKGNKYVRLFLGPHDSQDCFSWKSESDNWVRTFPVRPGTCLRVAFDNNLISDTRLRVNLDGMMKQEMRWEITRITEDTPIVSVPFWVSQSKDSPLNFDVRYRSDGDSSTFSDLMKKLVPSVLNLGTNQKPYALDWVRATSIRTLPLSESRKAKATVRRASEDSGDKQENTESWEQAYQRAQHLQQPVVINNRIVVLPSSDEIYINHRDFSRVVAIDCCVFVLSARHSSVKSGIRITGQRFTGRQFWDVNVYIDSYPDEFSFCGNSPVDCRLAVDTFRITNSELIIVVQYYRGSSYSEKYEWVVPLDQLPSWSES